MRSHLEANCIAFVAATFFGCTCVFGQNETDRFFEKLKPKLVEMTTCYDVNTVRFAAKTCEPASTVVEAAYGVCGTQERSYTDDWRALGGPEYADIGWHLIEEAKQSMRQQLLGVVLRTRVKFGLCLDNPN